MEIIAFDAQLIALYLFLELFSLSYRSINIYTISAIKPYR